ncbi:MAG: hypothetical protein WCS28_00410 [Thiomicrospira sp.]|jgi:hypothetical protein
MNMKKYLTIFTALFLALGLSACKTTPVQNFESQPVPSNIKSAEQVQKAIKLAGSSLGWIITDDGANKMKGVITLRSHQAEISIPYTAKNYSIVYRSSSNLNYNEADNSIHKNYNGWVQNLDRSIKAQLAAM